MITGPCSTSDTPATFSNRRRALTSSLGSSMPSMYFLPSPRMEMWKLDPLPRPPASMERMVSWIRSSMRMAPLVPRMVLMKNCSKPLVVAWVTTNRPTPSTMQDRLMSIARFLAVRKREAMRRLGDINGTLRQEPTPGAAAYFSSSTRT